MPDILPALIPIGENETRIWGMDNHERLRRIAKARGMPFDRAAASAPALLVDQGFVFDPSWIPYFAGRPGEVLTLGGKAVIAHVRDDGEAAAVRASAAAKAPLAADSGLDTIAYEDGATIANEALRKREQPFVMPLDPTTVRAAERASYFGAYKGVTDLLTKYLWPEWALVLTRFAARIGMSPNMVTSIGALFCVLATIAFWYGHYFTGMALGLVFMVLDTVDGKLARCTITSSKWGDVFDHGLDLVHPPFWWVAWAVGLHAYGRPLEYSTLAWVLGAILGGYVVQRLIEGAFLQLYHMHIHVWRPFDSQFRLITARRNPNMVILFVATLIGQPDVGLIAVAWWTVISLVVHAAQLVQAMTFTARGGKVRSWLE